MELKKVQRAKDYIDKLANGIDPISDTMMAEDCTLNNVRLSRCFFYVSDILRQVIENGGTVKAAIQDKAKAVFYLQEGQRASFAFSDLISSLPLHHRFAHTVDDVAVAAGCVL